MPLGAAPPLQGGLGDELRGKVEIKIRGFHIYKVVGEVEGGNRLVRFDYEGIFLEALERLGKMPLPP